MRTTPGRVQIRRAKAGGSNKASWGPQVLSYPEARGAKKNEKGGGGREAASPTVLVADCRALEIISAFGHCVYTAGRTHTALGSPELSGWAPLPWIPEAPATRRWGSSSQKASTSPWVIRRRGLPGTPQPRSRIYLD